MEKRKVIVIGAGAAGLMAAVSAARGGAAVRIIEKNDRPGKKLLATGNGRCNYTNIDAAGADYPGDGMELAEAVLATFGTAETIAFFEQLGILPRIDQEGRVYPYSEQAASVLAAFLTELKRLEIELITDSPVAGVTKQGDAFIVLVDGGRQYKADRVIVATGGKAGSQYGCTGDGYGIAAAFGHALVSPRPALVQVESEAPFFRQLKGVRAKGRVTLTELAEGIGKDIPGELGEIQFTDSGLSGICIFNLSRYIAKLPESGSAGEKYRAVIRIDLFPELSADQLKDILTERIRHSGHKTTEEFLNGIVNQRLIPVILKESRAREGFRDCASLDGPAIDRIVRTLKSWDIRITGTKGWREAQVTAGGIRTDGIDPATMESKLVPGLYFAGEIVNVDGRCGGYNLQWAWSSGCLAGAAASGDERSDGGASGDGGSDAENK